MIVYINLSHTAYKKMPINIDDIIMKIEKENYELILTKDGELIKEGDINMELVKDNDELMKLVKGVNDLIKERNDLRNDLI